MIIAKLEDMCEDISGSEIQGKKRRNNNILPPPAYGLYLREGMGISERGDGWCMDLIPFVD